MTSLCNHCKARRVHVYIAGFPCQPFSPAGSGKGLTDPRANCLRHCLAYIGQQQPTLVVFENSARLGGKGCPESLPPPRPLQSAA